MSQEKKLLIVTLFSGAMVPICAFGLSMIWDVFLIVGIYCGISALFCGNALMDLKAGKKPNLIPVGIGMAVFGFILLGNSGYFGSGVFQLSALYTAAGLLVFEKGIRDRYAAKHKWVNQAKKLRNNELSLGITLMVVGFVMGFALLHIKLWLGCVGYVIRALGILLILRGAFSKLKAMRRYDRATSNPGKNSQRTAQVNTAPFVHTVEKRPEETAKIQKQKVAQYQRLVNVLEQIRVLQNENGPSYVCAVCGCRLLEDRAIFMDGDYYCADCCGTIHSKGSKETPNSTNTLHQISYQISGEFGQSPYTCVLEIADRLLIGGFAFCKAGVGGGVKENSRGGVMAYGATYTDYDNFRNNAESDFRKHKHSALNDLRVCAFLARNTLKVYILSERGQIILRWIDTSDRAFAVTRVFAEKVIEEVYDNRCTLEQIDNVQLHDAFLSNWA